MNLSRFFSVVSLAATALALTHGASAKDDAELIREHVIGESNTNFKPASIEAELIENEALAEVFVAPVYKVVASREDGAKRISFAGVHDDQAVRISNNRAHAGEDTMTALLAEDFRIEGRPDAERLGSAISSIFASDFITDEGDTTVIEHEDGWILAQGETFGDVKGYRVTVSDGGEVEAIVFDPELPVDEEQLE